MEINDKYYEDIATRKTYNYDEIIKALDIVKKFLIREERILVGGMSIDYSLKLKGEKGIYDDDALPDYDFFSPNHHADAYNLVEWLYRLGFKNLSVINGLHPSTLRVRVNFTSVADITYVPQQIFEHIPTLRYKGFIIIHPHVQYIDQHRALCFPYENAPLETVLSSRPKKDMKRHDLLYAQYPLRLLNVQDKAMELKEYTTSLELLENQCITGFFALNYWIQIAQNIGFKTDLEFGYCNFLNDGVIKYKIPIDSHGISLYSDNIKEVYEMIKSIHKPTEERFYHRFLDKLPRKIILDNQWELLENSQMISAHKIKSAGENIYMANIQNIMMYLLVNYILLMKIKNIKRGYSFYIGYLQCRNLVTWASNRYYTSTHGDIKEKLRLFLPSAETYGTQNLGESYVVSRHNFDIKNKEKSISEKGKYLQPSHVYDRDLKYNKVPRSYFAFNPNQSEIFDFNGGETKKFV